MAAKRRKRRKNRRRILSQRSRRADTAEAGDGRRSGIAGKGGRRRTDVLGLDLGGLGENLSALYAQRLAATRRRGRKNRKEGSGRVRLPFRG